MYNFFSFVFASMLETTQCIMCSPSLTYLYFSFPLLLVFSACIGVNKKKIHIECQVC